MIPKIIHYCWLGEDPYSPLVEKCLSSWKKALPDYEFILWNGSKFAVESLPWTRQACVHKKYAFASDYLRIYALYYYGGIYLDTDVEVMKSFDDLLQETAFMGWDAAGGLEGAVLGAEKGAVWMEKVLAYYQKRHFVREDGQLDMIPFPVILQHSLQNISPKEEASLWVEPCLEPMISSLGIKLFPASYFSPKNIFKGKVEMSKETYCIHHFNGEWVQKNHRYYLKLYMHRAALAFLGKRVHDRIVRKYRDRGRL